MLTDNDMTYETYNGDIEGYNELIDKILERIKNEKVA